MSHNHLHTNLTLAVGRVENSVRHLATMTTALAVILLLFFVIQAVSVALQVARLCAARRHKKSKGLAPLGSALKSDKSTHTSHKDKKKKKGKGKKKSQSQKSKSKSKSSRSASKTAKPKNAHKSTKGSGSSQPTRKPQPPSSKTDTQSRPEEKRKSKEGVKTPDPPRSDCRDEKPTHAPVVQVLPAEPVRTAADTSNPPMGPPPNATLNSLMLPVDPPLTPVPAAAATSSAFAKPPTPSSSCSVSMSTTSAPGTPNLSIASTGPTVTASPALPTPSVPVTAIENTAASDTPVVTGVSPTPVLPTQTGHATTSTVSGTLATTANPPTPASKPSV